jgi:hypothetical protein
MTITKHVGKKKISATITATVPLGSIQGVTKQVCKVLYSLKVYTVEDFLVYAQNEEWLEVLLAEIPRQKHSVVADVRNLWMYLQKIKDAGISKKVSAVESTLRKNHIRFDTQKSLIAGIITFLHAVKKHEQVAVLKNLQLNNQITKHLLKLAA